MLALLILFVVASAALGVNNARLSRRLRAAQTPRELGGDEETLALLEAQSVSSPLAKKLLAAHSTLDAKPEPVESTAWLHDPAVKAPPLEVWNDIWEDFQREKSDPDRVRFLATVIASFSAGASAFTVNEKNFLLCRFENADLRAQARAMLFPPKPPQPEPPPPGPPPPFRWANLRLRAVHRDVRLQQAGRRLGARRREAGRQVPPGQVRRQQHSCLRDQHRHRVGPAAGVDRAQRRRLHAHQGRLDQDRDRLSYLRRM